MKYILLFIVAMIFNLHVDAQSLTIREIEGQPVRELAQRPKYDTLNNIQFQQSLDNYKIYVGQDIFFYPRSNQSTQAIHYYGNFKLLKPDTLYGHQPDTIWIKRRKNVKPEDYKLKYPISDAYKPEYVDGQMVCFGNNFLKPGINRELRNGYYTPAQEIEGKTFKIVHCEIESDAYSSVILYTLQDEEGTILIWEIQKLFQEDHAFPAIIVAYYEKIKKDYIGKSFFPEGFDNKYLYKDYFAQNIKKGGKYTQLTGKIRCTDLSLLGNENEYLVPKLIFEDSVGEVLAMDITIVPTLRYLAGYDKIKESESLYGDVFTDEKVLLGHVASLQNLIPAEVVYEKRRAKEQQRLAEERKIQEETEKREKEIFAKYKNKEIAKLIISGTVRIGMTAKMCIDSWGMPSDINTSKGSWGTHEQWVYGSSSYLYFENGILTAIQN